MPKDKIEQNYYTLTRIMILALILLTVGQVILYRNIQSVKSMISVTTMELKEGNGVRYYRDAAGMMRSGTVQENNGSVKK